MTEAPRKIVKIVDPATNRLIEVDVESGVVISPPEPETAPHAPGEDESSNSVLCKEATAAIKDMMQNVVSDVVRKDRHSTFARLKNTIWIVAAISVAAVLIIGTLIVFIVTHHNR